MNERVSIAQHKVMLECNHNLGNTYDKKWNLLLRFLLLVLRFFLKPQDD